MPSAWISRTDTSRRRALRSRIMRSERKRLYLTPRERAERLQKSLESRGGVWPRNFHVIAASMFADASSSTADSVRDRVRALIQDRPEATGWRHHEIAEVVRATRETVTRTCSDLLLPPQRGRPSRTGIREAILVRLPWPGTAAELADDLRSEIPGMTAHRVWYWLRVVGARAHGNRGGVPGYPGIDWRLR